MVGDYVEI